MGGQTKDDTRRKENLAKLVSDWIERNFGGTLAKAAEFSGISRTTLRSYSKASEGGKPEYEKKIMLAKAMGLSLAELDAKIEGVEVTQDISLDRLIEQARLCSDAELIQIDRAIADVRESRLIAVNHHDQLLN